MKDEDAFVRLKGLRIPCTWIWWEETGWLRASDEPLDEADAVDEERGEAG
jgi:hypothetical protein